MELNGRRSVRMETLTLISQGCMIKVTEIKSSIRF